MDYIFRVQATWMEKVNSKWEISAQDDCNRIFLNEEDAKGYCNLMNDIFDKGDRCTHYEYWKEKICKTKYNRYA